MLRLQLILWIITALYLGDSLRKELKRRRYLKKTYSDEPELPVFAMREKEMEDLSLPDSFDSREMWPNCLSIPKISDEGSCDSSWAVSAVDTMTDRICIHSKGEHTYRLSAAHLINCCVKCFDNSNINRTMIPDGCYGGNHAEAWKYWIKNGIVTGGSYDSYEGCQPYEFKPCRHCTKDIGNETREMCKTIDHTANCKHSCQPDTYRIPYNMDKHCGIRAYRIKPDERTIRAEIFLNGPVQASMQLFDDFKEHLIIRDNVNSDEKRIKEVYYHKNGSYSSMHAVRIIGWGYDKEYEMPYWLAANSYGTDWGDQGFFKIARGINECLIEMNVIAGIPDYRSPLINELDVFKSQNMSYSFWKRIKHFLSGRPQR